MIAFAAADSKGAASLWVRPLASTTAQRLENTDGAEAEDALPKGIQGGKVIGSKGLALQDRKVNLDLIQPTGVDGSVHRHQVTNRLVAPTESRACYFDPRVPDALGRSQPATRTIAVRGTTGLTPSRFD